MATKIPMDIMLTEILPKLPTKSLIRFKCVSKSFKTFISNYKFIDLQLRKSHDLLIIKDIDNDLYLFDLDTSKSPATKLTLPWTSFRLVVGSCYGLLCLQEIDPVFRLFNAYLQTYRDILYSGESFSGKSGFGYDHKNKDYKIVLLHPQHVTLYSLKADSWRDVVQKSSLENIGSLCGSNHHGVLVNNHLLHWLFSSLKDNIRIRCFNLCSELWEEDDIPLPEYKWYSISTNPILGVIDGCLSLMVTTTESVDMCVMKEYRNKGSWVKLFGVSHSNYVIPLSQHIPLAHNRESNSGILMMKNSYSSKTNSTTRCLVWYNSNDNTSKEIEFDGITSVSQAFMCKPSLVIV
ncbi:F-box protein CPR30-like [Chenopodium quinoa]|uniref:F-box domain-containing protein n=1 Tax=Chenopodium quinoa TaxID=63459 RepID=A0A803LE29_CHEQI|nr:F-box protein CPR30-like [Chenopodium quinoa]